jgi:hypothetical protein
MAELVSMPVKEYRAFEAALALLGCSFRRRPSGCSPCGASGWRHGSPSSARIDALVAGGLHPFFLVENEYRLALESAEKAFVEQLLRTLDDPQLIGMWLGFREQSAKEREKGGQK